MQSVRSVEYKNEPTEVQCFASGQALLTFIRAKSFFGTKVVIENVHI